EGHPGHHQSASAEARPGHHQSANPRRL
ncbi:uncharacterized protein METZ01_LOCUS431183, partial [marine metagenome]